MRRVIAIALLATLASGSCTGGASPRATGPSGDTGAGPSPSAPAPPIWSGRLLTQSSHRLYVGGTCETDWVTEITFRIDGGQVRGTGTAELTSRGNPCPFPVAQIQIRRFSLRVSGTFDEGRLTIRLRDVGHVPSAGADDLGGFRTTVLGTDLHLRVRHARIDQRVTLSAPDQDRGEFDAVSAVRLTCASC